MFYDNNNIPQPAADRLGYNDSSLIFGGKFDLPKNWCTGGSACGHDEHRIGINNDTWAGNVASSRYSDLEQIFRNHGSPNFRDEVVDKNHWHLRF